ncbi:hypothetical protein RFI_12014 [Reticulomyxa filosa]|uniref:Uncharacterized protein n=1 Tax=Reticulomyxa filosa TaxID=46433 RepID=X6NIE8_RETFI|nr:hypothetical protein RFI_12014 [Reticulomyxa filosa]|eukprot:ETO25127.1 hypothetical protein RFI_12014 [Reticulomyxa filosa]
MCLSALRLRALVSEKDKRLYCFRLCWRHFGTAETVKKSDIIKYLHHQHLEIAQNIYELGATEFQRVSQRALEKYECQIVALKHPTDEDNTIVVFRCNNMDNIAKSKKLIENLMSNKQIYRIGSSSFLPLVHRVVEHIQSMSEFRNIRINKCTCDVIFEEEEEGSEGNANEKKKKSKSVQIELFENIMTTPNNVIQLTFPKGGISYSFFRQLCEQHQIFNTTIPFRIAAANTQTFHLAGLTLHQLDLFLMQLCQFLFRGNFNVLDKDKKLCLYTLKQILASHQISPFDYLDWSQFESALIGSASTSTLDNNEINPWKTVFQTACHMTLHNVVQNADTCAAISLYVPSSPFAIYSLNTNLCRIWIAFCLSDATLIRSLCLSLQASVFFVYICVEMTDFYVTPIFLCFNQKEHCAQELRSGLG